MDKETFFNYLMLAGLIAIFLAGLMAYYEFKGAERYCSSIDGKYKLNFFPLPPTHYCNKQILIQYSDGWSFEKENLNNLQIIIP